MVGRADDHGIDLGVHFVQQLAEVLVPLGLREAVEHPAAALVVDVAQGHDVLVGHPVHVVAAAAADADAGDVQLFVRRSGLGTGDQAVRRPDTGGYRGRSQHVTAGDQSRHGRFSLGESGGTRGQRLRGSSGAAGPRAAGSGP